MCFGRGVEGLPSKWNHHSLYLWELPLAKIFKLLNIRASGGFLSPNVKVILFFLYLRWLFLLESFDENFFRVTFNFLLLAFKAISSKFISLFFKSVFAGIDCKQLGVRHFLNVRNKFLLDVLCL